MVFLNGKGKQMTIGTIAAAIVGAGAIAVAWSNLGLPKPLFEADLERFERGVNGTVDSLVMQIEELKDFGKDTRILLLEDQLWNNKRTLANLRRDMQAQIAETGRVENWISRDVLELERQIESLQRKIRKLENGVN